MSHRALDRVLGLRDLILIVIGTLAYGIDRLLYWFQVRLFPYLEREE